MKHLKIEASPSIVLESINDYVPSVAMEGFVDTLREKFKQFKTSLSSKPEDAQAQAKKNATAVKEFKNLLKHVRADLSKSNKEVVKSVDLTSQLDKLGIKATNSSELISGLKAKLAEMQKQLNETGKIIRDTRNVAKSDNESAKNALGAKVKALEADIKEVKKVQNSGKIDLDRRSMMELTTVLNGFCDLYLTAYESMKILDVGDDLLELAKTIPVLESRDGGVLGGIIDLVVGLIKVVLIVFAIVVSFNMLVFVITAHPYIFMFSTLVIASMYALRDQDDPRTRERDRNRRD